MNKTLSANIGGVIFNIDEDAYHKLFNYLDAIKRHFTATGGGVEIMEDIEARIAEMLQEKQGDRQIVNMKDVDEVMAQMGMPEDFQEPTGEQQEQKTYADYAYTYGEKRFFRNSDDKILGGVCSGISAYFGIDPLWLRLAFVIAVLFFGTGILLYIILWVIIPEAITPAEKLQMRGEQVTVSNLEKKIKEEARQFKERFDNFTSDPNTKAQFNRTRNSLERFGDDLLLFLKRLLKFVGKVAGIFIVVIGLIILISFFLGLLGVSSAFSVSYPLLSQYFFEDGSIAILTTVALIILVAVPVIWAIVIGIIYLAKANIRTRFIHFGFLLVWLSGLALMVYAAFNIATDFRVAATERTDEIYAIKIPDTLRIEMEKLQNYGWEYDYGPKVDLDEVKIYNDTIILTHIRVEVENSSSDSLEVVTIYSARGDSRREAIQRARKVEYNYALEGNILRLDPSYSIGNAPFRDQRVRMIIRVPNGVNIATDRHAAFVVDDYDFEYRPIEQQETEVAPADTSAANL